MVSRIVAPEAFLDVPSVRRAVRESNGYLLTVSEPHVAIPALLQRLEKDNLQLSSLTTRHINLEDVFVGVTGRRLDEE